MKKDDELSNKFAVEKPYLDNAVLSIDTKPYRELD